MTNFECLIKEIDNKVDSVTNFLKNNETLMLKIKSSAIEYYNNFFKEQVKDEKLNESVMFKYYLLDCFYYNCISNQLSVFERGLSTPQKGFSKIFDDQKNEKQYYVPTLEEIKNVFLYTNWEGFGQNFDTNGLDGYDELLQFLVKEYGLPLEESKNQIENISKVLEDLILKNQIEKSSDSQIYKIQDYLTLAITSEVSLMDGEIEDLKKKYSKFPISYESDIYYKKLKEGKKYSENILRKLGALKDASKIKQYVISTLVPKAIIKEAELDIYSSKKIVEQSNFNKYENDIVSITKELKNSKTEEEKINIILEQKSDLEELYKMDSFKEFLVKVENTKEELKRVQIKLRDLSKIFVNNIFLLNEQVNLPASVKKNNSNSVSKINEIFSMKFKEDKNNLELVKETVEIIKKSFFEAVRNQLIVINVVYPIYDVVKNNEQNISSDDQVIEFFANRLIEDNAFSIKAYIENVSKKITDEGLQKIENTRKNIIETSVELFPDKVIETNDEIEVIGLEFEEINNDIQKSKQKNTLEKEELEILLEYANDLKKLSNYYTPLEVEQKLVENYFELEENSMGGK